jgi:hypothetical protein
MLSGRRSGAFTALLLAAVTVLAACDSGGGSSASSTTRGANGSSTTTAPLPGSASDFDAGAAATKIRQLGNVHVAGTAKLYSATGRDDIRISYSPYRMAGRIAVPTTLRLADIELRRIGDLTWVRRAIPSKDTTMSLGLPILVYRAESGPPFLRIFNPDTGAAATVTNVYDPAKLLDDLHHARGVVWRRVGDHEHAVLDAAAVSQKGVKYLDVWTDGGGRPVRLRFDTALDGTVNLTITRGKPVKVAQPPASQTQATNQPLPDATDGYVTVARADAGGTPVEIQRAPARDDWSCWKVNSTPAFVDVDRPRPSGAYCIPPVFDTRSDDEKFGIPLDASDATPYELLVLLFPPGTTGQVTTLLGTQPLNIDGLGTAVVSGPAANPAVLVTVRTPAGTDLVCGPGGVVNEISAKTIEANGADTRDPALGGLLRGSPWNCMPKDLADSLGLISR